ncbi:MAG: DUF4349 domain-containing protein [Clostridiales bacterium]|nr:DUF4349 domain-containing protein [Clostridiales bacterium]
MKNFKTISARVTALVVCLMIMASFAGCASKAKSASAQDIPVHNNSGSAAYATSSGDWGKGVEEDGDYDAYETSPAMDDRSADTPAANPGADTVTERKLIRTCGISAQTEKFDDVVTSFKAKVNELGGYFESSNIEGTGKENNLRTGSFVVRVPQDKMDALLEAVNGSVTVISSSENSEDRTLQYVDMEAKVKSLKTEQQTLMDLLAKAENLESIITLQNRLSEIRYEIESYETQLKTIDNKVTYSTLNISIREVIEVEEQLEPTKRTFLDDMKDAMEEMLDNVVEFGKGVVILFIMCLPLTIVLLIGGVITIILVKRANKKRAARRAAAAAAANAEPVSVPAEEAKSDEGPSKDDSKEAK